MTLAGVAVVVASIALIQVTGGKTAGKGTVERKTGAS
jgi:hypothetical protein